MALSDSMFLFEILVKDLHSYIDCKEFNVTGQFADIFAIHLKNPVVVSPSKQSRMKTVQHKYEYTARRTSKLKKAAYKTKCLKTYTGKSILIINKSSTLLSFMKKYPLEIFISNKNDLNQKLGSATIPWGKVFKKYLMKRKNAVSPPAIMEGVHTLYDELTLKRIASITMSLKLTCLRDKLTSRFMSISADKLNSFICKRINSKPTLVSSTLKESHQLPNESRINVSGKSHKVRVLDKEVNSLGDDVKICNKSSSLVTEPNQTKIDIGSKACHVDGIKSDTDITKEKIKSAVCAKSCSSFDLKLKNNLYRYIFGDPKYFIGNKLYQVGYFTVERDDTCESSPRDAQSSEKSTEEKSSDKRSTERKKKFKFKKCDSECLSKRGTGSDSVCSVDLPEGAAHLINLIKCKEVKCGYKKHRELPLPSDDRILLDLTNLKTDCCASAIEEVVGGVTAKMNIGKDPCFCTCECTFGFSKKTTYCAICGGYETAGEDLSRKTAQEIPHPCPIFHKLIDKNKLKTWSTSGSESRKKGDDQKSKTSSGKKASDKRLTVSEKKNVESEKSKKKKKDDRFKFNYGYKGIPPQIGHSKCALPCTGTLENVPKNMGWLWSAEDVPGMKFRPMWKPGASNKHVVRLLKIARNPGEVISKKKRKDTGKKKRPLKRPLLVVHKKDGEYNITMETMKAYSKPRAINQHPYEDKPVVTYTICRTDEENRERVKKKEREQRRLERAQRHFMQSAFRNMCHEICLKTYQQALGILTDTEDPECACYPAVATDKTTNLNVSCSCSEDKTSIGSDTDSDEWIVEFTPPNATFDPTYKGKKVVKTDNGSQYTYLDYRVKLLDRFGNPVPRYFKGPDGKQECSDLGGFWGPNHKWLELNVDGYVAPDGKWAPNTFIGPYGEQVDAETGKFQTMNNKWLIVGIDGYIDNQGKWKYYLKPSDSIKKKRDSEEKKTTGDKNVRKTAQKSEATWSCFGDVSPKQLSKMGIFGHGEDRKLLISMLQDMLAHGEDVKLPEPSKGYNLPNHSKRHMKSHNIQESYKCNHPAPSDKGIIAVDGLGNKTYFRLKDHHNDRPNERMASLAEQGISLSSFHVPCFHSFINSEVMKQQQRDRIFALSRKSIATQAVS